MNQTFTNLISDYQRSIRTLSLSNPLVQTAVVSQLAEYEAIIDAQRLEIARLQAALEERWNG